MPLEFAQRIRRIPSYPVAAGYELGDDVAMLASNESCFAPLPAVVEAARRVIDGSHRYPDPSYWRLRSALAERYGLPPERIALGNGSCDILLAAGEALLEPGAEVVYSWPAFSVYPHLAATSGARAIEVPLDAAERHDLDAMLSEVTVATRLVLICNPNNPTSTAVGLDEVERFLDQVAPNVCVILDEAYVEFSLLLGDPHASVELLRRLGLWVAESDANFIWVLLPEEAVESDVVSGLAERRVLVRAGKALGREGAMRVTVGTDAENERFIAALAEILG